MRRTAHLVVLAVIAALIVAFVGSPSSAQAPGKTKVTGKLSVEPNPPVIGQKVKVGANFSNGSYKVTLFRQNSGSSSWDAVDTKDSNEFGNAWFHDVQIDGKQKLYARIVEGKSGITNTMTISPTVPVEPNASPIGELGVLPAAFYEGQPVEVQANFPDGTFDVSLYKKVNGVWTKVGTDTKKRTSGNAYFKGFVVTEGEELFALRSDGESTGVETFAPVEILPENFPESAGSTLSLKGKVYDGQKGTVVANFPNGTFDVTLFRDKKGVWTAEGSARSNSSGDATITGVEFDGADDYFALASTGQRTPETVLTPAKPSDVTGGPAKLGPHVIYVTTNNGGTPTTRGVDYESKAVLVDGDDESETLAVEEFAVRGNSTSTKPKKPYKIKFEDDLEPYGLAEDNNFVLLANYLDASLVRTEVAFMLGRDLEHLAWTPKSAYAELFLNGKYMGSYQMVESIKLDKNRVKVADKTTAQIIEFDPHYKEDGVPGMSGQTGVKYSWKDPDEFKTIEPGKKGCKDSPTPCPDPEGLSEQKIADMKTKIKNFEKVLYGTDNKKDWSKIDVATLDPKDDWQTYLDLSSAVDYYLAKEFTKDQDADMFRSNYFYTENVSPASDAKFIMGPLWDFDRSAGVTPDNYPTGVSKPTGWWMRGNGSNEHDTNKIHWFTRIAKDPRFLEALDARWAEKKAVFENAGHAGDAPGGLVSEAVAKIGGGSYDTGRQVAENDRARWKGSGSRYDPKTSNYGAEVEWLRGWYDKRYAWVDSQLG